MGPYRVVDLASDGAPGLDRRSASGPRSLVALLRSQAESRPLATAFAAIGQPDLTYRRLCSHIEQAAASLRRAGLDRNDPVALVLPDGPELAVALLSVAAGCTAVPLNPAYSSAEFGLFLRQARARALIVESRSPSCAREVSAGLGIPIFELIKSGEAAGLSRLSMQAELNPRIEQAPKHISYAQEDDVAFLLATSGTTGLPRLLPVQHFWAAASCTWLGRGLGLTEADRYLEIMPLFHMHGIDTMLATIASGGAVICEPGFRESTFFEALTSLRATWFSAAPSLHQAICTWAGKRPNALGQTRLRFIKSGSAPLPIALLEQMEALFKAPVVEVYGTTETGMLACNPTNARRPGSVGKPSVHQVAVLDASGQIAPFGVTGEIAYLLHPDFQAAGAPPGKSTWTLTGDLGHVDADGYVFIDGRTAEIINRGGEKVSPAVVDEALEHHPAVARAVTFPVPHPTLGESVAAAVVLNEDSACTEEELRHFAAGLLAPFELPQRVVITNAIPASTTGKPQRAELAALLGLATPRQVRTTGSEPQTEVEQAIAALWGRILHIPPPHLDASFFELGGDSLSAIECLAQVHEIFGVNLPADSLLEASTVRRFAQMVIHPRRGRRATLVELQPKGAKSPLFCVHNIGGEVLSFGSLATHLDSDRPLFGLQSGGHEREAANWATVEELARYYVREIQHVWPVGPYYLVGHSAGGTIAFEMAQQLIAGGESVAFLALLDNACSNPLVRHRSLTFQIGNTTTVFRDFVYPSIRARAWGEVGGIAKRGVSRWAQRLASHSEAEPEILDVSRLPAAFRDGYADRIRKCYRALQAYQPRRYPGKLTLFRAKSQPLSLRDPTMGWGGIAAGGLRVIAVPGSHSSMLVEPNAAVLARKLEQCLARIAAT